MLGEVLTDFEVFSFLLSPRLRLSLTAMYVTPLLRFHDSSLNVGEGDHRLPRDSASSHFALHFAPEISVIMWKHLYFCH